IVGDFTVSRLADDRFYLIASGAAERYHLRRFAAELPPEGVALRAGTTERAAFAIAGPNARRLLERVAKDDVSNAAFPFLSARELDLGVTRALVLRVAYTGDLGYEIHFPVADQPLLLDAFRRA